MSLSSLIRERRSIRRFNKAPVSRETVEELLEQATRLRDPDGDMRWRCIYAGSPEANQHLVDSMLAKVKENKWVRLMPAKWMDVAARKFAEIPAHLIVLAQTDPDRSMNDRIYADTCRVLQAFQLLAWEQGLGMLWDTEKLIRNKAFYSSIGMREGERFVGILHMGHFDKPPRGRGRTPADKKWSVYTESVH
ncbi:nitroreductase family protein [Cohnella boryungensis]|uniref:nitroreductase family protein n=1 Tax=Cohnella boryungensis TaxID=768479 RepID=UPI00366D4C9E